jgi:hypothetical protein
MNDANDVEIYDSQSTGFETCQDDHESPPVHNILCTLYNHFCFVLKLEKLFFTWLLGNST